MPMLNTQGNSLHYEMPAHFFELVSSFIAKHP